MIEEILNPTNWVAQSVEDQLSAATEKKDEGKKPQGWYNLKRSISPLALYKYLKARFGSPNGFVMFLKNPSSDNLIHWHYALVAPEAIINIWGKTSGLEIYIKTLTDLTLSEKDWLLLEVNLQAGFKKYSKEMKTIQSQFEHWSLFINPFSRIEQTLNDCLNQLERLNLDEIVSTPQGSKESLDKYHKELKRWTNNIGKAATLGTTIRMLCPVMAEAFVNLLLLIFRKDEYKNDERLYESLTRQQIDVRVKTLHLHCICFPKQIDHTSPAFKNFHTLMNGRNDFLHGNIDPNKLIVEEVWFDQKIIPLFEKDEGFIKKMMRNYCTNVERQRAIVDFQIVSDFIELVFMAMEENYLKQFVQLLSDRMPGINKKTKRLGALFPSQYLVENHVY
jgi:hypothetical protein